MEEAQGTSAADIVCDGIRVENYFVPAAVEYAACQFWKESLANGVTSSPLFRHGR
jgi:hypothetical protein